MPLFESVRPGEIKGNGRLGVDRWRERRERIWEWEWRAVFREVVTAKEEREVSGE